MDTFDRLEALEKEVGEQRQEIERLEGLVADKDAEIMSLELDVEDAQSQFLVGQVAELAKVRGCLWIGRHEEGREQLERVLGETGEPWRLWQ